MNHPPPTCRPPSGRLAYRPAAGVAATCLSLLLAACGGGDVDATAGRPALTVEAVLPQVETIARHLPASGPVAAWQEVAIGVELTGLRILSIEAEVGQQVRRGQVLARIDAGSLESDVEQARAAVTEARAAAAEAQANAERARALAGRGALSERETDQLLTAAARADAGVQSALARLANARRRLGYATVTAPDDGLISARSATPGEVVGAGAELFRLIRQSRIEWRAEVPERDFAQLRPGMAATVLPLGAPPVPGTVRTVSPGLDPATRRGVAYVDVPLTPHLRPGMYVSGRLDLGSSEGVTVPLSAVSARDGSHYLFVLGDDLRVSELKVEIGTTVGERVEVLGGLPAGARVVRSGAAFLRDGDLVALAEGGP